MNSIFINRIWILNKTIENINLFWRYIKQVIEFINVVYKWKGGFWIEFINVVYKWKGGIWIEVINVVYKEMHRIQIDFEYRDLNIEFKWTLTIEFEYRNSNGL